MPATTRHLLNRQRRLAATAVVRTREEARTAPAPADRATAVRPPRRTDDRAPARTPDRTTAGVRDPGVRAARGRLLVSGTALLTVVLGTFAGWAAHRAAALRDDPAADNTALTDNATTSEVKGTIAQEINAVFSYNYADPATTDDAAKKALTGKAVGQYAGMLAAVRKQAPALKLVLTTTVTDSGVELLEGNRARLLVFADQRNTSTDATSASSYSAAMFAVDAVRQGGTWKVSGIDTFSR